MSRFEALRQSLPPFAKDIKLNLQTVLRPGYLDAGQAWGCALAVAYATKHDELIAAVREAAAEHLSPEGQSDAAAAATLMAMNNVYYRFRHMIGKQEYTTKPARLRMSWMAKPATDKTSFELYSLAVSAVGGCELCLNSHEAVLRKAGLTHDQVHDAVRIAATISGAATALTIASQTGS